MPQPKRKRRIMTAFKIDELSCVDFPAQQPARMALLKRHNPDEDDYDSSPPCGSKNKLRLRRKLRMRRRHRMSRQYGKLGRTIAKFYPSVPMSIGGASSAQSFTDVMVEQLRSNAHWKMVDEVRPALNALSTSLDSIVGDPQLTRTEKLSRIDTAAVEFLTIMHEHWPEVAKAWDESKHPRDPKGSEEGGEFAEGSGGEETLSGMLSRLRTSIKGEGTIKDTGRKFVFEPNWDSDWHSFEVGTLKELESKIQAKKPTPGYDDDVDSDGGD